VIAVNDPAHSVSEAVLIPAIFTLAWLGGLAQRERTAQAEDAEERARRAEAARRLAVAEERARIARELHDVVAHAMSVMVLQVGAVRHGLPPGEDADALRGVERTGREALGEMRRLLGALRREDEAAELTPQPGMARLDALVEDVRRAGLAVRLEVDGEPVALPVALDVSAYRIVQEGLTNALKHAGGASEARVRVSYGPGALQIEVRDDGRGPAGGDGLGHGLVGIRERVTLYGGSMTAAAAGPRGGFTLRTSLPLGEESLS
jgi:signal transduction histidine kinase